MFPSIDTNGYDLVDPSNPHQTTMLASFNTYIQSPSSDHQHPLPSFPLSADTIDESVLISQFLLQQQENVVESPREVCKKLKRKKKKNENVKHPYGTTSEKVPWRGNEKRRDRHSKICTAQGPRDRRMRLSLHIARKFFDLQDMLGFDKASKTIEWLISKSKASIKQVKESVAESRGEGEEENEHLQVGEKAKDETLRASERVESSCKKKELREKARERARERTMTKMKMRLSQQNDTSKTFSNPYHESVNLTITGGAQVLEEANQDLIQEQEWSNVSILEEFLGLTSDSSSFSIFEDAEEPYTSLSSIRGSTSAGAVTPREQHNTTSVASANEERNPISSFSLQDYLCY